MTWLGLALAAHATNAIVFVVDKALLTTKTVVGKPVRYAVYSSLVAAGAGVLLVFMPVWPSSQLIYWSLAAGAAWVVALWLFFIGLKRGEPSRVVPITGSAVPLFTLVLAALFLGERLGAGQLLGVLLLVLGGTVLSLKVRDIAGLPGRALLAAVAAGAAFAVHFALMDRIYETFQPFLAAFAYGRLGVGAAAVGLWVFVAGKGDGTKQVSGQKARGWTLGILGAFVLSKGLGTLALVLQNYAISLGSVTLVNALQGFQYVFLLGLAAGVSRWRPRLFREQFSRVSLTQKAAGIVLVSAGLWLIV